MSHLGLQMNLKNFALSQRSGMDFRGIASFNGSILACCDDGIVSVDNSSLYDDSDITSRIDLITTDFGTRNMKRIRSLVLGYETSGYLRLTVTADDVLSESFTITPVLVGQSQHGNQIYIPRGLIGRYWTFSVENIDGCDFSIDSIDADIVLLSRYA